MKDVRLNDLCDQNPYASIPALVYLQDVNKAKKLLIGKTLYTRTTIAKTDDANSYSGYREVNIAKGEPVKITTIDVGNKSFPVKITFIDRKGVSYYINVAMSRTNSGMEPADFQAEKKNKLFSKCIFFHQSGCQNQRVYPVQIHRTVCLSSKDNSSQANRVITLYPITYQRCTT